MAPLLIAEWLVWILTVLLAVAAAGVLAVSLGMCGIAAGKKARGGEWPAWAGKAGAALGISATIAAPIFAWVGYVATL